MAYLNDGRPYHVSRMERGVPPLWPEAKDGDRIDIHDGRTITTYQFDHGEWIKRGTAYVRE